ncbi:MAG: hypothetical protein AAFO04_05540 [Cyanobacteria bacterium J06592_8]
MSSVKAARQGDSQAIAEVLNYLMKIENIAVKKAYIQNNYLNLTLEAAQFPISDSSIKRIYDAIKKINIKYIQNWVLIKVLKKLQMLHY